MEQEFITYEQALALKELGFDKHCFAYYSINNIENKLFYDIDPDDGELTALNQNQFYHNNLSEVGRISAPLKSQVLQWFRDKHQLYGEVHTDCTTYPKFCYSHTKFFGNPNDLTEQEWGWENTGQYSLLYSSYTQAESELINHLISIINNK